MALEGLFGRVLWKGGIRYRKNHPGIPGKPDIAITKWGVAFFCDGGAATGRVPTPR
jgi:DNA mismatch endonuclease (patch repair protein)